MKLLIYGRTVDRCLTAQLLKHFGCSSQSIARLADRDVEHKFLDTQFPHGVLVLSFSLSVDHDISYLRFLDN